MLGSLDFLRGCLDGKVFLNALNVGSLDGGVRMSHGIAQYQRSVNSVTAAKKRPMLENLIPTLEGRQTRTIRGGFPYLVAGMLLSPSLKWTPGGPMSQNRRAPQEM